MDPGTVILACRRAGGDPLQGRYSDDTQRSSSHDHGLTDRARYELIISSVIGGSSGLVGLRNSDLTRTHRTTSGDTNHASAATASERPSSAVPRHAHDLYLSRGLNTPCGPRLTTCV